jgi:hypothetical protein
LRSKKSSSGGGGGGKNPPLLKPKIKGEGLVFFSPES